MVLAKVSDQNRCFNAKLQIGHSGFEEAQIGQGCEFVMDTILKMKNLETKLGICECAAKQVIHSFTQTH